MTGMDGGLELFQDGDVNEAPELDEAARTVQLLKAVSPILNIPGLRTLNSMFKRGVPWGSHSHVSFYHCFIMFRGTSHPNSHGRVY